jgi:hypothetical protein
MATRWDGTGGVSGSDRTRMATQGPAYEQEQLQYRCTTSERWWYTAQDRSVEISEEGCGTENASVRDEDGKWASGGTSFGNGTAATSRNDDAANARRPLQRQQVKRRIGAKGERG